MKSSTTDKVQGTAKIVAGKGKEITGKVFRNPRLQAAGKMEKTAGRAQKRAGEIKKAAGI